MSDLPYPEFQALLVMQNRLLRDLEPRMRRYGLSSTGFLALLAISQKTGTGHFPLTRAELTRRIGVTPGSMSVLMARMIKMGWVSETRLDDRSAGLAITAKGRSVLHGGMVAWDDAFAALDDALSATMKSNLIRVITKVNLTNEIREREAQQDRYLGTLRKHKTVRQVKDQLRERRGVARAKLRALDES